MSSRHSIRRETIAGLVFATLSLTGLGCSWNEQPIHGAVVESCEPGEAAAAAGLEPGDIVVEWRQGRANGDIRSVFDLAVVEQELAPHGPVKLIVKRGSNTRRVVIPNGRWRIRSRPTLRPNGLADAQHALELETDGDFDGAAEQWRVLAEALTDGDEASAASWATLRTAVALAKADRRDDGLTTLQTGVALVTDQRQRAAYWERSGDTLLETGLNALAAEAFRNAIATLEEDFPSSPALAHALLQLCRTDMRACDQEADRALEVYQSIGNETIEFAVALNLQATVDFFRSNLEAAENGYLRAFEITHEVAPGSPTELNLLGNLGLVAMRRGDFDTARSYFKREQTAAERLSIECIPYAFASNYLGLLAKNLGRYDEAQLYYEQALRAFRAARPDGVEVAGVLTNLGVVARYRENLQTARSYHEEALRLRRRHDPESTSVASSLHNVGAIALRQGDLEGAREALEQALDLKRSFQEGSLWVATTTYELGELAREEGDFETAAERHRSALEIRRRVASRHPDVAASLIALGGVEYARNRPEITVELLFEAVDLIEEQRRRLNISEEQRSQFKARYRLCYIDLAGIWMDQGRTTQAWNLLEQARAGALRSVVDRRDSIPEGVPRDLWFAKTRTESGISRTENRLARLDPGEDEAALAKYRERLAALETELREISEAIREVAPALAELESPAALTLDQVRKRLDAGTLVLSYSVGADRAMAMMTTAADDNGFEIRSFHIPVTSEDLSQRVQRFNSLIGRGASTTEVERAIRSQARKLFDLLVAPAWDEVSKAKRILIVPDGPLHELPFAALAVPDDEGLFLGLAKPIFVNPSATTAVELGQDSRHTKPKTRTIAAFGGPEYPSNSPVVKEHNLRPLPGSRIEVESIRRLFGANATVFLGPDATEANFRAHVGDATILHCALHARSDPRAPMDSSWFFSIQPGTTSPAEDGILSAWDIVDGPSIGADTVVLSSCSTARGRVVSGEGIIGLARAFHVAGAKTLIASQWPVPDHSTAELMTAFYEELASGASTVEALHRARQVVASDPKLAHPYHWASFQIRGDWR
jgi:CHAT domain-containing protein/Tfp pilus assembly protein PilF